MGDGVAVDVDGQAAMHADADQSSKGRGWPWARWLAPSPRKWRKVPEPHGHTGTQSHSCTRRHGGVEETRFVGLWLLI